MEHRHSEQPRAHLLHPSPYEMSRRPLNAPATWRGENRRSNVPEGANLIPSEIDTYSERIAPQPPRKSHLSSHTQSGGNNAAATYTTLQQSNHPYHRHGWTSAWLRTPIMFVFILIFAALAAALVVLWRLDKQQNGFAVSAQMSTYTHYAWTYGPTAILILVTGLWRQILYYTKVLQAWQEMRSRPVRAEKSVLLDYMWPSMIEGLCLSIKNCHWPVSLSILGFLALKAIIVISTSLFTLQQTQFPTSIMLRVQNNSKTAYKTFDYAGETLSPAGFNAQGHSSLGQALWEPLWVGLSSEPVNSFRSTLRGDNGGLLGLLGNQAFPTLQWNTLPDGASNVTAIVKVSESRASCAIAKVSKDGCSSGLCLSWDAEDCPCQSTNPTEIPITDGTSTFQRVICDINAAPPNDLTRNITDPWYDVNHRDHGYFYKYVFAMTAVNANQSSLSQDGSSPDGNKVSAVICNMTHSVVPRKLSVNVRTNAYTIGSEQIGAPAKSEWSDLDFSEYIISAVYGSDWTYYGLRDDSSFKRMFDLMSLAAGSNATNTTLLDPIRLQNAAEKVLSGMGARLLHEYTIHPEDTRVSGDTVYIGNRLRMGQMPLYGTIAGFSVMILLTIIIRLSSRQRPLPSDPSNLALHATVLAISKNMQNILQDCGHLDEGGIKARLAGKNFQTITNDGLQIVVTGNSDFLPEKPPKSQSHKREWTPLLAHKIVALLVLILPLLAGFGLEVLHQLSIRNNGVLPVESNTSVVAYAIRYSSVVIALIIATAFNSLEFTLSTMETFSIMKAGASPAKYSIFSHLNGMLTPVAICSAMFQRSYGGAIAKLAGFVGSLLTIAVSGLWILNDTQVLHKDTSVKQVTKWDPNLFNSTLKDNGASLAFDKYQHGFTTESSSIWNDVVFPSVSRISQSTPGFANSSLSYEVTVPVLRPTLKCEVMPANRVSIDETFVKQGATMSMWYYTIYSTLQVDVPSACGLGPSDKPMIFNLLQGVGDRNSGQYPSGWLASLIDLRPTQKYSDNDTSYNYQIPGCPTIGFSFGFYERDMPDDNVTVALCSQQIQQVMAKVTYYTNDKGKFVVDKHQPLQIQEGTATLLSNATSGATDFSYGLSGMSKDTTRFNEPFYKIFGYDSTTLYGNKQNDTLDNFFNHLVYGPNGTAKEALLGAVNATTLVHAVERLYNQFMVYQIDNNFRGSYDRPTNSGTLTKRQTTQEQPTLSAVVNGPAPPRLRIEYWSKLVLQVLLGIMTVLGVLSYLLVDTRGTLPRNPWSIASTMALFVDSEMCKTDNLYASKAEEQQVLLQRWKQQEFSIGWWRDDHDGKGGQRFGIDVGTADRLGLRARRGWKALFGKG